MTALRAGPISAAEYVFGADLPKLQAELSDMLSAKFRYIHEMVRQAEREG